jgi:hypothetical protein
MKALMVFTDTSVIIVVMYGNMTIHVVEKHTFTNAPIVPGKNGLNILAQSPPRSKEIYSLQYSYTPKGA